MSIVHTPIGHPSPLSPQAFAGLAMTPRVGAERGVRADNLRRIDALSALPAATDAQADLPGPVEYALDKAAEEGIAKAVEGLELAAGDAKRAEADLAAALHVAKTRYYHESRSGLIAARALTSKAKHDKDALAANAAAVKACDAADRELPALKAAAEESRRLQDLAYGTLRGCVAKAFDNLRLKAGRRYTEAIAEATRCVALIDATTELQPRSAQALANEMCVFHLHLSVPSLPDPLHCQSVNGREMLDWKSLLLAPQHSRLTANTLAAKSALTVELRELLSPLGLDLPNVVI
jgi:hypothetical protein